jgi:pyrroline-5-carboxylate reductase
LVVEPFAEARQRLQSQFGLKALPASDATLTEAGLVIWAVKPQAFKEAAQQTRAFCGHALHLSVAAGIRSDSIANWLGTERVVRAMPNTPALVGLGQTGLFARAAVTDSDKAWVEHVVATTGALLWVKDEPLLDAVTALSGSGPAYVFFFIESMVEAGVKMGLTAEQATQLAIHLRTYFFIRFCNKVEQVLVEELLHLIRLITLLAVPLGFSQRILLKPK